MYSRITKHDSTFSNDNTIHEETFSTINKPNPLQHQNPPLQYTNKQTLSLLHTAHKSYPFMIHPFSRTNLVSKAFSFPKNIPLTLEPFNKQQSQDPLLRKIYSWLTHNEKPVFLTPLIIGTPFLHANYKRFSQHFIDDSTNRISLYTKITFNSETHPNPLPNTMHNIIRICHPFRMFKTVFNKLHEYSHTDINVTYYTLSPNTLLYFILKNGYQTMNSFHKMVPYFTFKETT